MVRGIGRLLFVNSIAAELASMRTHEDMVLIAGNEPPPRHFEPVLDIGPMYIPPRRQRVEPPPNGIGRMVLVGSERDLGPGPCSYRATGSKRSRRRKKR